VVPFETAKLSLEEAIGKAGGVLDERGDPDGIFVLRYEPPAVARALPDPRLSPEPADATPVVYHLKLRDPNAMFLARRFAMRDKDILYVSNAPLSDVQKVLTLINFLVTPVVTGATINNSVR
jgi:polysaccharide export outer membrane protein